MQMFICPRQTPKGEGGVVSIFLKKVLKEEAPFIFGESEEYRGFRLCKGCCVGQCTCDRKWYE